MWNNKSKTQIYDSFKTPQILFVQILIGKEYLHLYVIKDNKKSCYDKELEIKEKPYSLEESILQFPLTYLVGWEIMQSCCCDLIGVSCLQMLQWNRGEHISRRCSRVLQAGYCSTHCPSAGEGGRKVRMLEVSDRRWDPGCGWQNGQPLLK